ncbi:MAG: ribonuclease J [Alphaproteobacteria bacterium]|nr:ribonuclease J [Alphaproteobacteria bacterium]
MNKRAARHDEGLYFLPLGGSGEIGMNLNLYRYGGKWLMVDLGITFGDDSTPGVDVLMPDPAYIVERRGDLAGLVLTHAHEDHLGAVPYLWNRLKCPVYATPFTAAVLRRKLAEMDRPNSIPITEVPLSGKFSVGPFEIELITLTHSIPEPNAVAIRTPAGTVLHTGDWKIDPKPMIGEVTDEAALRALGQEGVLAMVCDSTNALQPGHSRSEGDLRESLVEVVGRFNKRVAIGCFSSNIARLETIAHVAKKTGRHPALVGRSLWRMYEAAQESGYLKGITFLSDADGAHLPRDKLLMACTGSQGEKRSALWRIAADDHPNVVLEQGDAVVFSSRVIPGNEKSIQRLQNQLVGLGVKLVTDDDAFVHVSGHPNQDELAQMYQWVRPRIAVPVHGEIRHMRAHAALARACQVPEAIVPQNGTLIRLAPGPAEIVEEVPVGRLALDGALLVPLDAEILRKRTQMIWNGSAVATVVLDRHGRLAAEPQLTLQGLFDGAGIEDAITDATDAVRDAIEALPSRQRANDDAVREAARVAVRRAIQASHGKRPPTEVHLVRL